MYLLIKYIKSVLWRVLKRLSYIQDARCLKVKVKQLSPLLHALLIIYRKVKLGLSDDTITVFWNAATCSLLNNGTDFHVKAIMA